VGIDEVGQVVDLVVNNTPEVFWCVVLCDQKSLGLGLNSKLVPLRA
jgi:hypothetical protein